LEPTVQPILAHNQELKITIYPSATENRQHPSHGQKHL